MAMPSSTISRQPTHIYDIEHIPVDNDPRKWSTFRKNFTLALVSSASMIAGLSANIQNPHILFPRCLGIAAVQEMHDNLHATSEQFSLSIAVFILLQGVMPLLWAAISEVKGRKPVYLISLTMFAAASVAVALSPNMKSVIGFRCLQATGGSAVMAIGASTLADIFEPEVRGTKMGIYYIAPLLGPSLGPILGGVLTTVFNWRAIFWFLAIYAGASCLSFLLFRDTYRKERSLVYQKALRSRTKQPSKPSIITEARLRSSSNSTSTASVMHGPCRIVSLDKEKGLADPSGIEKGGEQQPRDSGPQPNISWRDVSPFKPIWLCLTRLNNFTILAASGLSFAFNYTITYTAARTLAFTYGYNPLKIGLVSLSFGLGCVAGSLGGGRWSDYSLAKLKKANGGKSYPEMRLKSTLPGVVMLPPAVAVIGWVLQERTHTAVICLFLFLNGFFHVWPYTSALAYIVDANQGRSSIAVATNSLFRGTLAFAATEVTVPLQDRLGDGWMMTLWALVMLISGLLMLLTYWKGKSWRERAELREAMVEETN